MKVRKIREKRMYFTSETEDAIILYNNTESSSKKNKIYEEHIHHAFFKLTQNIIHTFKYYNTDVDELEHLQHEVIIFLISKLPLYNHCKNLQDRFTKIIRKNFNEEYNGDFPSYVDNVDKVTQQQINDFILTLNVSPECLEKLYKLTPPKAFSYYGTIAKRWLILYNEKNYNKKIQVSPIEDLHHDENHSYTLDLNKSKDKLSNFIDQYIEYMDVNLYKIFPKPIDTRVADAVLELFRKRENIDLFEKKSLYIFIREQINVKTPKITKIVTTLKSIFMVNYIFYLENDYISFDSTYSKKTIK
jgi:hypothetical protein